MNSYLIILMHELGHTPTQSVSDQAKTWARGVGFMKRNERRQSHSAEVQGRILEVLNHQVF